mmetsp:Transcript_12496/g.17369  ORF Transcript_12496/g.17369 Transcript_12496/m.17369 type:complete len:163 (-) Transcript_12496:90-578(-)
MGVFPPPPPQSDGSIEELLSWLVCTRSISKEQQQQKKRKRRENPTGTDGEVFEGDVMSSPRSGGDSSSSHSASRGMLDANYRRKFFTSRRGIYGAAGKKDPAAAACRSRFAEHKGGKDSSNECGSSDSALGETVRLLLAEVENEKIRVNENMIAAAYRLSGL